MIVKNAKVQLRHKTILLALYLSPLVLIALMSLMIFLLLASGRGVVDSDLDTLPRIRMENLKVLPRGDNSTATPSFASALSCESSPYGCLLAITPDTPEARQLGYDIANRLKGSFNASFFANEAQVRARYSHFRGSLFAYVTFDHFMMMMMMDHGGGNPTDINSISYAITMNATYLPEITYRDLRPLARALSFKSNASGFLFSGFATLQTAIDSAILARYGVRFLSNTTVPPPPPSPPPQSSWTSDYITASLFPMKKRGGNYAIFTSIVASLVLMMAYAPLTAVSASFMSKDRCSGTDDYLLTLGLKPFILQFSHGIAFLLPALWVSLLITLCSIIFRSLAPTVFTLLDASVFPNPGLVFTFSFIFALSCISFGHILSRLVQRTPAVIIVSFCWVFLPGFLIPLLPEEPVLYYLLYLLPPASYYFMGFRLLSFALPGVEIRGSQLTPLSTSILVPAIFQSVDLVLHIFVAWYLNEVSTINGPRHSPFFLFTHNYWCPKEAKRLPAQSQIFARLQKQASADHQDDHFQPLLIGDNELPVCFSSFFHFFKKRITSHRIFSPTHLCYCFFLTPLPLQKGKRCYFSES